MIGRFTNTTPIINNGSIKNIRSTKGTLLYKNIFKTSKVPT